MLLLDRCLGFCAEHFLQVSVLVSCLVCCRISWQRMDTQLGNVLCFRLNSVGNQLHCFSFIRQFRANRLTQTRTLNGLLRLTYASICVCCEAVYAVYILEFCSTFSCK